MQFEAAWCLTNVASGDRHQTQSLIQANAISAFVKHLSSPHLEITEQVIWGLGNLAGDGKDARDQVLASGAGLLISQILDTYPNLSQSFVRNAAWTLANLCRPKP